MRGAVKIAVILVGDELLAGHTRDANAHYLAQRLNALGHRLRRIAVVPDEAHDIQAEVDAMLQKASVVFVCGGLGPTHDDRTTEALAEHFNRRLVVDEASWDQVRARYGNRPNLPQTTIDSARKMVTIPEGAEVLDNPLGAACGYVIHEGEGSVVVLPGVPAEMQAIFEQGIVGKLVPRAEAAGHLEVDVEMAEAAFAHALSDVAGRFGDIEIGSYPHFGEKRVTLRFRGDKARAAEALEAFFTALPEARALVVRK